MSAKKDTQKNQYARALDCSQSSMHKHREGYASNSVANYCVSTENSALMRALSTCKKENAKLKQDLQESEKELVAKNNFIRELSNKPKIRRVKLVGNNPEARVAWQLKKQVNNLNKQLNQMRSQNEELKQNVRFTKLQEIASEIRDYEDEYSRLSNNLVNVLKSKGYTNEKINAKENMEIGKLKIENQELLDEVCNQDLQIYEMKLKQKKKPKESPIKGLDDNIEDCIKKKQKDSTKNKDKSISTNKDNNKIEEELKAMKEYVAKCICFKQKTNRWKGN